MILIWPLARLMRGRKPKPTHLKIVGGNPGHRPFNAREPRPRAPLGAAPEWMTPTQQRIWADAVASAPRGLLTALDASPLIVWVVACETHQRSVMMQARLDAAGGAQLLAKNSRGEVKQSPYVQIIRQQALVMLKAAAELGFTPSARTRVQLEDGDGERDPAEKYFA